MPCPDPPAASDGTGPTEPGDPTEGDALPEPQGRREAEDWALALMAEGFDPRIDRSGSRFRVVVPGSETERARHVLDAYREERRERARERARAPAPAAMPSPMVLSGAYALALGLLAFHLGLEQSGRAEAFRSVGRSQSALVLEGEAWRLWTALTLHADLAHVLGNTLFGGLFLAAVAGRIGLGLGLLAFVVPGVVGNLANALYHQAGHSSVGASTGVFGLVGVLAGLAAWQRHRQARPGRGAWVAFGAGLALLAMLGTGGMETDFSAHVFGLVAGAVAGLVLAAPLGARPAPGVVSQATAAGLALGSIALAWGRALAG